MRNLFIITLLFLCSEIQAQVKIGTTAGAAHASAELEVESTTRGVLLPRMTSAQRSAISSAAAGLMIYNTSLNAAEIYDGSKWIRAGFRLTTNSAPGSTYSISNGTNPFSANTACTTKLISAGHNATSCSGSVVVGSNSYNQVLINGQCWMQTNLNEAPSNFVYNNTWFNTSLTDLGRWGYYNAGMQNGTAGFQSTEPAPGEGLLYQWSAAMNGSTTERAQGACPAGWHIPSDCEYMYLEHGLGMSVSDQNSTGVRTSGNVGTDLSWSAGTNSSGFTGLMPGQRLYNDGSFNKRDDGNLNDSEFWVYSSTIASTTIVARRLSANYDTGVGRTNMNPAYCYSIRCLKD